MSAPNPNQCASNASSGWFLEVGQVYLRRSDGKTRRVPADSIRSVGRGNPPLNPKRATNHRWKYEPPLNGIALSGFALVLGIGFLPWIGLVLVCIGIIGLVLSFIFSAY
jgi:hypothetical protein